MVEADPWDTPDAGSIGIGGADGDIKVVVVVSVYGDSHRYPARGRHGQGRLAAVGSDPVDLTGEGQADVGGAIGSDRYAFRSLSGGTVKGHEGENGGCHRVAGK